MSNWNIWEILSIGFGLIVPSLIIIPTEKLLNNKLRKILALTLGMFAIIGTSMMAKFSYNKESTDLNIQITQLNETIIHLSIQIDSLTIENNKSKARLEVIAKVNKHYSYSDKIFKAAINYYLQNLGKFMEIPNYSEENIPTSAINKKYEGYQYSSSEKFDEAIKSFESALKIYPNYYTALLGLGIVYQRQAFQQHIKDNEEKANAYFEKAEEIYKRLINEEVRLNLKDPTPYYQLAFLTITIKVELGTAEDLLVNGLKRNSNYGEVYNIMGLLKENQYYLFGSEIYLKESLAFYKVALSKDYYLAKSNINRLEKGYQSISSNEALKICNKYFKEKGITFQNQVKNGQPSSPK